MAVLTSNAKKATQAKEVNKAVVDAVAAPEEKVNTDILGSKSASVAFVAALGDPSRDDITIRTVNGKETRQVGPTIVGYRFKALEDMEVPDCGTEIDLKADPMAYQNPDGRKAVKAGETFDLTRFETGLLMSPPEFNAKVTGGEMQVVCTYQVKGKKTAEGVAKISDATQLPMVSVRIMGTGSIKDVPMVNVLNCQKTTAENGVTRKTRTPIAGFEKWASLCKETVRRTSGGATAATPAKTWNQGAKTFMNILAAKKGAK